MKAHPVSGWWIPPVAVGVVLLFSASSAAVESTYSRTIYPWLQGSLTTMSNLTPFAWFDPLLAVAIATVVWRAWGLGRTVRQRGLLSVAWEAGRRVVRGAGLIALLFLTLWGLNYRRVPLEEALGAPSGATPATVEQLRAVLMDVGGLAARLRPQAVARPLTYEDVSRELPGPFNRALALVARPPLHQPGRPKYTLLTPYFTWAGIDGMTDPFGLESIVHPDVLPFERPFVLAHEWAHLAGQGDEAGASAIGWLACMQGDTRLAYSASMYLIVELAGALPRAIWLQAAQDLDPGVRDDLRAIAERWRHTQPTVQRAASHVYDRYLRANGVEDGVASYSRALQLILLPQFRAAITIYQADRDPRP